MGKSKRQKNIDNAKRQLENAILHGGAVPSSAYRDRLRYLELEKAIGKVFRE